MTDRLYYEDSYLTRFRARVVESAVGGTRVYLDRTAFYPSSGGQPFDTGAIGGVAVVEVIDEEDRIAHLTAAPVREIEADCRVDWERRFDHMQQHTGQHVLSAVLVEMFGAPTVGFHLGEAASTIDVGVASLDQDQVEAVERRANQVVFENRPARVSFESPGGAAGLRKPSQREGLLRIVSIEGLDRSACGGTHVRSTGEIGLILIRKLEKIRGNVRVEFLCGGRAVARARADYNGLGRIARAFAAPLDEAAALVAAQQEKIQESERTRRRLATELASLHGRELYAATQPSPDGMRRHERRLAAGSIDDELRTLAQGFTSQSRARFLAVIETPPSALLACSKDSGLDAGKILKEAVTALGGRGGGSPVLAQGSVPDGAALERLWEALRV